MKRKIKKKVKKRTRREQGNTLLFVLVLLVIIVSIFSTLIVLNSIDKAKHFFISQQKSTANGRVEINIMPNPERPGVTGNLLTGKVTINVREPGSVK